MNRLAHLLLGLLQKLLSSAIASASIKRLLALYNFIRRQFSIKGSTRYQDSQPRCSPPRTSRIIYNHDTPNDICPSLLPVHFSVHNDSPYAQHVYEDDVDDDEIITTSVEPATPIHSPRPSRGFSLPFSPESPTSQNLDVLMEEFDNQSISSRRSASNLSAISLPIGQQHGLVTKTSRSGSPTSQVSFKASKTSLRPTSHNSPRLSSRGGSPQPMKVSRAPTPHFPVLNTASPSGALPSESPRASSPQEQRIIPPMSTATVQRWDRNLAVYVKLLIFQPLMLITISQ